MYEIETKELEEKLSLAIGRVLNVMSPKQLKELLYDELNLPPQYKKGTTKLTTNEEALDSLRKKSPSPIFDLILTIRGNRKLLGTYLADKGGEDGRMRCSYIIGGTETGRLSSRQSVFRSGTNLQNIPKGVCRRMFVADEGKVFVQADLSQAEARVVAYLSEEEKLIDLFGEGVDVYKQVASWIFNKPISEITTGGKETDREIAKHLIHASNYGIGSRTFARVAGVSEGEAKRLLQRYFDTFPKIKAWHLRIQSALGKSRTMTTPMGRKRTFFGLWGDQLFREAYAFVPQATVADVLNLAIIKFHEKFPDIEVMLQIHDAFVIQVSENTLKSDYVNALTNAFDIPIYIAGRTLKIPIDLKSGKNWDEMEVVCG